MGQKINLLDLKVPYDKAYVENITRELGKIESIEYKEDAIYLKALINKKYEYKLADYIQDYN